MSILNLVQDFGASQQFDQVRCVGQTDDALEEKVFAEGFAAGMEEARRLIEDEQQTISKELAETFADWSFTHKEAQGLVLVEVLDFLTRVFSIAMPEVSRVGLGLNLAQELAKIAVEGVSETLSDQIHIEVASTDSTFLRPVLARFPNSRVNLVANDGFPAGKLRISHPDRPCDLDLSNLLLKVEELCSSALQSILEEHLDE